MKEPATNIFGFIRERVQDALTLTFERGPSRHKLTSAVLYEGNNPLLAVIAKAKEERARRAAVKKESGYNYGF